MKIKGLDAYTIFRTMVYELAHLIKKRFGFVWDCVEWGNSELFALFYKNRLQDCEKIINDGVEMYELPNVNGGRTDVSFPRIILKFHEVFEPQFFYGYAA